MENNPKRIYNDVAELMGNTPLLRLNKYPKSRGVDCQLFCKLEQFNPGGSIKDRVGYNMVKQAQKDGIIKKGDTVIESTSGNTGMGILLASICEGFNTMITIPDKFSNEKICRLASLGAEVIVTPCEADHHDPENYWAMAQAKNKEEGFYHTDQYSNPNNPNAHYLTTGPEIIDQMDKKLDFLFTCIGTGGTVTGLGKRMKESMPDCKVVAVDPYGSMLARPYGKDDKVHSYNLEGMGNDFVFDIINYDYIDDFVKVGDKESFIACRDLMKEDGVFPGGSCGACLVGAMRYLKEKGLEKNKDIKCVLIFPDGAANYMSKYVRDEWMVGQGYLPPTILYKETHPLAKKTIKDYDFIKPIPFVREKDEVTISECLDYFGKDGYTAVAVIKNHLGEEVLNGRIDKTGIVKFSIQKSLKGTDSAKRCKYFEALGLDWNCSLAAVQKMLEERDYIFLLKKEEGKVKEVYCLNTEEMFKIVLENKLF